MRTDPDGVMQYVSGSVRAYEPEQLVGTSGEQFVHPDDLTSFRENTEAALKGERQTPHQRVDRHRTGAGDWV